MKRAADANPAPPTASDATRCAQDLEEVLARTDSLLGTASAQPHAYTTLELVKTDTDLCLVCKSHGLDQPPRLLRKEPLAPLYKKWRRRKGKKDDTCYAYVHDYRTGQTTGGPPENIEDRRVIKFSFAGLPCDVHAWFLASAQVREYTFLFDTTTRVLTSAGWVDPRNNEVVYARQCAPMEHDLHHRSTAEDRLHAIRHCATVMQERHDLRVVLEKYPAFTGEI